MELTFGLYSNHQCITKEEIIKKMYCLKNFDIVCFFNVSHILLKKMSQQLKKECIYNDEIGIIYTDKITNIKILNHKETHKCMLIHTHNNKEDDMLFQINKIFSTKYLDNKKEEHNGNHDNNHENTNNELWFTFRYNIENKKKHETCEIKPSMNFLIGCLKKYNDINVQNMLSKNYKSNENIILISNSISCCYEYCGKMNILHNILGKIDIDEKYYNKKYEHCSNKYMEYMNLLKSAENKTIEEILYGKTNICSEDKEIHYKLIYPLNEKNIHHEFYKRINEVRNKYLLDIPELNHILVSNNLYEYMETLEILQLENKQRDRREYSCYISSLNKYAEDNCNKKRKCVCKKKNNCDDDICDNNEFEVNNILYGSILYFKICFEFIKSNKIENCNDSSSSSSESDDDNNFSFDNEIILDDEHKHKHNHSDKHYHKDNHHNKDNHHKDNHHHNKCEIDDNSILTNMIADHAITEKKIESGSISSDKIKPNTIKNVHLSDNIISGKNIINKSIDTQHLADKCITNKKIAPNSISKSNILSNSISTDKIEDKSITSAKICDNSILISKLSEDILSILNKADELCNDLIDSDKLAPNSVTNEKIENSSITNNKLTDNCVRRKNIEDFSISHNKLSIDCVDTCNIVDGAILHEKLSDECVKTANICDGAIKHNKLDEECIKSSNLTDGCITHKKLSNDCIKTVNIALGSITHEKLSDDCIKNANIVDGTITHKKLADNVIHTANLNDKSVTCEKLSCEVMHLIHEGHLRDDIIVSDYLSPGCVTHDKLSEYCVNTRNIMDNSITFNKLEHHLVNRLDQIYDIQQFVNEPIMHNRLADYCIHNNNLSAGCILKSALSQEVMDLIGNTNRNTAFYLNTTTGTVNISSVAPIQHQTIVAISPTIATWQTLNHQHLSNIGSNSHSEIDEFITQTKKKIDDLNKYITSNISTNISTNIGNLKSLTTTIDIGSSQAPIIHQCLVADSPTVATWKTIDHLHLSNVGTNTHQQIDTFITQMNTFKTTTENKLDSFVTNSNSVSLNGTQILTNKTIIDRSNKIAADFLHTNNGSVNVSNNTPLINQTLVAMNGSNANWQYINHDNLLNIGTHSHAELDAFIVETRNKFNDLVTTSSGVSLDGTQILTNKTLNDRSNIIAAGELFSNANSINLLNSNPPNPNQVLTALSETEAEWQTIDHGNLSNVGRFSHGDIDSFMINTIEILHNLPTNYITTDDVQILTNKTLDDHTNIISANYLFCNNGTNKINIFEIPAPFQYQVLMASDAANASWETIDHINIQNIGRYTHEEIDTFIDRINNIFNEENETTNSGTQTLTNKTIDDISNFITCDNLHSATTTINIKNATAPTINQVLIATSSTAATWQTINHINLINVGTHTHEQIDEFIASTTTTLNNLATVTNGVTLTGTQTMTHKTLDDISNIITCDNLRSATSVISIKTATAPTLNQALIANSSTAASWQTINHANLTNIGTNTHAQIDAFIASTTNTLNNLTTTTNGVTLIGTQTLTHKTLDDITNFITCDNLHSTTTTININNATAPTINQALIATSSTAATWQTINHLNLSNVGTNTHAQIDAFIASTTNTLNNLTTTTNGVTLIGTQTLTHKTLDDASNFITCDNIRSSNAVINIKAASPPSINQVLTATSSSAAIWQTVNHLNLSNVGTNTHAQIDAFIASTTTTLNNLTTTTNGVTLAGTQTLTNKTINDITNIVTCDNLRSTTGIINIKSAIAPTINQSLIATSGTTATWQTINHTNLSNIGTNTHAQIDTFISNTQVTLNNLNTLVTNSVTLTSNQILTNKVLNSTSNFITCDNLRSSTTVININAASAPIINQVLVATSSTAATWQTINHNNLSNVGTNTHAQIDAFMSSTTATLNNLSNTNNVTLTDTQTLTNKTLDSTTNVITCDHLHSLTTTIDVHSSQAPLINQVLVATSSNAATWQTINHNNLANSGTNTHAQIDLHLGATYGVHGITGNVVGTTDVQTIKNKTFDSSNIFPSGIGSSNTNLNYNSNTSSDIFVSSSASATSYVIVDSMSLLVPSGTYLVTFSLSTGVYNDGIFTFGFCNTSTITPITSTIVKYSHRENSDINLISFTSIITSNGTNRLSVVFNFTTSDSKWNFSNIALFKNRSLCATKIG